MSKEKEDTDMAETKRFTLEITADDELGIVTAMFAQMDIVDRGGDVIQQGAFGEQEVVVSAFNHASSRFMGGDLPVGKGKIFEKGDEAIAELQFFLNTEAGREHFEVIKALGGLQEYSFGFQVTETGELTEDQKLLVTRARKIERFLGQPMFVAEKFHGLNGEYVSTRETVRGFREILDGKHDDLPEQAFFMVGTIDQAVTKAEQLRAEA